MKNIIVSIGGSGTKVAEALVRLLAVGFPVKKDAHGVLTSAGEELEIWRIDTDQSSGAGGALKECVEEYQLLQENLEYGWSMKVNPDIVQLNPLDLPRRHDTDNVTATLEGVLNSGIPGRSKSKTQLFLNLFYSTEEQKEDISRGFYQKPFIGAPIMSVFASSLAKEVAAATENQDNAIAALKVNFSQLQNQSIRFFLCGSLHGGTGASGVAVFGQFLKRLKNERGADWRIVACLLAPYCLPPQPFSAPEDGANWTNEQIKTWFANNKPAAAEDFSEDEKIRAFKQIARGFYADLDDLNIRALHNLSYYDTVLPEYFDYLYLVGKPGNMDQLPTEMWSNGGANQRNPLNSAEVVAALTALRYFAGTTQTEGTGPYIVGSSNDTVNGPSMNLYDLPRYEIPGQGELVDPEKVFLATAIARHLIHNEIKWDKKVGETLDEVALRTVYQQEPGRRKLDAEKFAKAAERIRTFIQSIVDATLGKRMKAIGWNQEKVWKTLDSYLPTSVDAADALTQSFVGKEGFGVGIFKSKGTPPKPAQVGRSAYTVKLDDFRQWFLPEGVPFNRGTYFRLVWSKIYEQIGAVEPTIKS